MRIVVVGFLFLFCHCAKPDSKDQEVLNDSLLSKILSTALNYDFPNLNTEASEKILTYSFYTQFVKKDELPELSSVINPQSATDIMNVFRRRVNMNLSESDSIFFAKQILSKNEHNIREIDFPNLRLKQIQIKVREDYMRKDSTIVFFLPILTTNLQYAYIRYNYKMHGYGMILENENNNWIRKASFDTWNVY